MKGKYVLCLMGALLLIPSIGADLKAETSLPRTDQTDESVAPRGRELRGVVVDAKTGEPLPGVTVVVKGTTFGVSTDKRGHFVLGSLPSSKVSLEVRGVGFKLQTLTARAGESDLKIELAEDNIGLDEVVVSSNRQATLRRSAPTLVTVLDGKLFERSNANNLSQGLVFQPGVRVENNCQNCGFTQVRINGLDGRYSQILIDSRPVMSALAGVYGIEQIPTNMIDRVEVVRGGGSALYGSSAIAGVINVITKEPVSNSVSFSESLGLTEFKSLDNNLGFNASLVSDDAKAGAMIFGQARYRKEHGMNGDDISELGFMDSRALGFRGYVRPSDLSRLTLEVHSFQEDRRGGDHLEWPLHVSSVTEATEHSVYSGNLKYDLYTRDLKGHMQLYTSAQHIKRDSYYGGIGYIFLKDAHGNDIKAGQIGYPIPMDQLGINYGHTKGFTYVVGGQYAHNLDKLLFMPAQVLAGVEYTSDRLRDVMPQREWITPEVEAGGLGGTQSLSPRIDQRIRNFSQFAQVEWKTDMWSFLLGARLDEHSAVDNPILSPRATIRFNPSKSINLRATYAKGFRAPQIFDEDLHVGVVNGEAQRITNADGLRPEVSHAFSISSDMYTRIGQGQLNVLVEGFYTRLEDVFTNNKTGSRGGITYFERNNYGIGDNGERVPSGAKIFGMNLEAKYAVGILQLQAGLTLTSNKYDAAQEWGTRHRVTALGDDASRYEGYIPRADGSDFSGEADDEGEAQTVSMTSRRIMRTPSVYGYFTFGLNPIKPLNISLTGTYTGRMWAPHAIVWGQNSAVVDRDAIASGARTEGYQVPLVSNGAPLMENGEQKTADPQWDELRRTPAFFDLGAKVSYDLRLFGKTNLQLFAGVTNIFSAFQKDFDLGPDRDSAYIYGPSMPRSGYAGFKFTF